jgi:regulator of protease activity HflC (stomatin/prohibitin superfamily)
MNQYGYRIIRALVTDVNPDQKVKQEMNNINASLRAQEAAKAKGEAEKIRAVKAAEADAESKRLQGEGIAAERRAIVDGLRISLEDMAKGLGDSDPHEAMQILLLTQYFDTLATLGKQGATTILLPGSPSGLTDLSDQIREAVITGNLTSNSAKN